MEEKELTKLKKTIIWFGGIIAVALALELAVWAFAAYQANRAIDDLVGNMTKVSESSRVRVQAYQQQRKAEQQRQQQKKLDQNTLCAMNTDTNKCVCIHRQTGQKISIPHNECVSRASSAANIKRIN